MNNVEIFAKEFSSVVKSKIDVSQIVSRKDAWDAYYNVMLEVPILVSSMPEVEHVSMVMKNIFYKVDWVN